MEEYASEYFEINNNSFVKWSEDYLKRYDK